MNPCEYEIMAQVEHDHWWYRGVRDLMGRTIAQQRARLPARPAVLDIGCGTGENLRFLQSLLETSYLGGMDASETAVQFAREKAPNCDVYVSDIHAPEFHHESFDLVISCDLFNAPGLEWCLPGLHQIAQRMRPGGMLILNLPAYAWLSSDHDLAVHNSQRFVASEIRQLLKQLGLTASVLSYRLCGLFPLVVASRLPSILRKSSHTEHAKSALKLPMRMVNEALFRITQWENRAISSRVRLPFGSSVFAVGIKPV